jgi:hypothetical protein
MNLSYYETTDKQIDTCYLQSQVEIWIRIRIWDIRFALISDNISIRIQIRIKL